MIGARLPPDVSSPEAQNCPRITSRQSDWIVCPSVTSIRWEDLGWSERSRGRRKAVRQPHFRRRLPRRPSEGRAHRPDLPDCTHRLLVWCVPKRKIRCRIGAGLEDILQLCLLDVKPCIEYWSECPEAEETSKDAGVFAARTANMTNIDTTASPNALPSWIRVAVVWSVCSLFCSSFYTLCPSHVDYSSTSFPTVARCPARPTTSPPTAQTHRTYPHLESHHQASQQKPYSHWADESPLSHSSNALTFAWARGASRS